MNHAATTRGPFLPQPWLRVSDVERDGVIRMLRDAYAEGRLDDAELDTRVDQVLASKTYADLHLPLRDLVPPARPQVAPADAGVPVATAGERFAAMLVHLSGYMSLFMVPLIVYLCEGRTNSYLRDQAAQATNFHLTFLLANVAVGVASVLLLPMLLFPVIWVAWMILPLVGGVVAGTGGRFRYPLTLRMLR